jgi:hypothetical protein
MSLKKIILVFQQLFMCFKAVQFKGTATTATFIVIYAEGCPVSIAIVNEPIRVEHLCGYDQPNKEMSS